MAKTLQMVFRNDLGKTVTFNLAEPKEGLTQAQVMAVMQDMVTRNIFMVKEGQLVQAVEAKVTSRDVTALA